MNLSLYDVFKFLTWSDPGSPGKNIPAVKKVGVGG